jgi:hypothetical protein
MTTLADGTGAWSFLETVLLTDADVRDSRPSTYVVHTPLDAIFLLENGQVTEVVLGGSFARNGYIRTFLHETYPRLVVSNVVTEQPAQTVARNSAMDAANTSG